MPNVHDEYDSREGLVVVPSFVLKAVIKDDCTAFRQCAQIIPDSQ